MPIDYQQIFTRIKEIGAGARERKRTLDERRIKARELLVAYASELDLLRSKVDTAKLADANTRCALPLNENLASRFAHPAPASVKISGGSPEIFTETELLYGDDLLPNGYPMSEGLVALKRDLAERSKLEELSKGLKGSVVTFTDGPIELWGAKGEDANSYEDFVQKYLGVLSRLQSRDVITAGYVDKPSADLVVRLLEIASADNEQIQKMKEFHPLRGVSDRWLFGEHNNPLLPPGHRSAVFKIQSSSEKKYKGVLELHFFYLNVGTEGHPWPVRVEIPKWVADDKEKLDLLHGVLVEQCRMMGSKPYPYLLHRAHETAVVKMEEKQQIEQMLAMELRNHDEEMDDISNKSSAKGLKGRTRR